MDADPAAVPPPEWTSRVAEGFFGSPRVTSDALARLLASVREAAIREAAEYGGKWQCDGYAVKPAILSLLHTPPSGGAG